MKILLISPSTQDDIVGRTVREIPYLASGAFFAPHALAAVAALTPRGHEVRLHDEHMRGPVDELLERERFDVVGISLITNQLHRTLAIAETCKAERLPGRLVIGGIGTTNVMDRLRDLADAVFIGEAEETWPAYLKDLERGEARRTYQQISKPDMALAPVPRWELIAEDIPRYGAVSVQTSRGCPHDCSFCDVIYTYGRRVRSKSADQVLDEVRLLHDLRAQMVMFADDNLTAPRSYVKGILGRLKALNNSFPVPLTFMTQADITIARDEELLELLADCNFLELQIGIESFEAGSLEHMNKRQNLGLSIPEAVLKIQSYGIAVQAHMIVGADADDAGTLRRNADFIQRTHITHHSCHPLMAPPGTRLWYELKAAGRLVDTDDRMKDELDIATNVIPRNMTRIEMMESMVAFWDEVYRVDHYLPRIIAFVRDIARRPEVKAPGFKHLWRMRKAIARVFRFYLFQAPKEHRRAFLALIREARRHGGFMVPRVMFLYTRYLMDRIRDEHGAKVARDRADWERRNADAIRPLSPDLPVPAGLREQHEEIIREAYLRIRPRAGSEEGLYRGVLESLIALSDDSDPSFPAFDAAMRARLHACCDGVGMDVLDAVGSSVAAFPEARPPLGFEREILDALDHVKRYGALVGG